MWLLKDGNGKKLYLQPNRIFTVGRKKGSLVLNDDSVSRHHAEITVIPKNDNADPLSICKIKDSSSKYGTFLLRDGDSELRLTKDDYHLRHMDKIRFGSQNSIYTVVYVPILTAISGLNKDEKHELQALIDAIDGKISLNWDTVCTHLTVTSNPVISQKFTCALAYGAIIVPIEYWKCALKAFKANEELPDPVEFAGIIDDKLKLLGNVSINPDPRRKTLFSNLQFVHYDSNQYALYKSVIELAGGKSLLYEHTAHKNMDICADNIIVMQLVESNTTQATGSGDAHYAAACEKLGKCRRRAIPTSEIAIALFRCSLDKCCSPTYDHASVFKRKTDDRAPKSSLLAVDTQDVEPRAAARHDGEGRNVFISESTEQESKIESQMAEIVPERCRSDLPVSTANTSCLSQMSNPPRSRAKPSIDDSQSQYDEASIKIATLNYGKYLNDEEIPTKRNRDEENDDFAVRKKKICKGIALDERHRDKPEETKKQNINWDYMTNDDEDMDFLEEKPSMRQDSFEMEKSRPSSSSLRPVGRKIGNEDSRRIRHCVERDDRAENISESHRTGTSVSKERSPLKNMDGDEKSRKRKAESPEVSQSWDILKSPSKRNRATRSSPKKICKLPERPEAGQTTITKFLSPKKNIIRKAERTPLRNPEKLERNSTKFITTRINSSEDMGNDVSSRRRGSDTTEDYKKHRDPNGSTQPLLRIDSSPTDIIALAVPKFGKKFRKTYTMTPHRIELNDMLDMRTWSEEKNNSTEKHVSSDEEATAPRKVLPFNKIKKNFRV